MCALNYDEVAPNTNKKTHHVDYTQHKEVSIDKQCYALNIWKDKATLARFCTNICTDQNKVFQL